MIVQAGSSESGKTLAAAPADVHFAILRSNAEGLRYRADFNARLARVGRTPDSFKIVPGILPIVAETSAEARDKQAYLETLMLDSVAIDLLSSWAGIDLTACPADGPLPALPDEHSYNDGRTVLNRVRAWADQNLSIRQIAHKRAKSGSVPTIAGTATKVADQLEAWFVSGAVDGYNLMFPLAKRSPTAAMSWSCAATISCRSTVSRRPRYGPITCVPPSIAAGARRAPRRRYRHI